MEKKSSQKANKEMILRALTDPAFRRQLVADPAAALGKKKALSAVQLKEVKLVLAIVKNIDRQIGTIADELLCANGGGGCGIA
jgi:hypothetical protein